MNKDRHSSFTNRQSNIPTQYQKGYVEFYKLKFKVTPDVLIPRPETELLVDEVICFLANHPERAKRVEGSRFILDVGTGSGNIAISIAKNLPNPGDWIIIATDISEKALKIAKLNAKFHQVENKIKFIKSNLLSSKNLCELLNCHLGGGSTNHNRLQDHRDTDIIVTNLPYIPKARIPYLDSSVKDFEPFIALNGGEDGFELYRKLFKQIKEKRIKFKLLVGEIDYTQGELAIYEAQKHLPNFQVEVKKDLTHRQRILTISDAK